ncbi:MAG: nitroreductase family protein [Treponema sp.]|nr:nitroreductase family protein [Treponema sp.]
MDTLEAIKNRHSFRGSYKNTAVPRENLQKILEAGLAAPSGCNKQTTSLIALDDPALVNSITSLVRKNGFKGAGGNPPAGICVLTQKIAAYEEKYFYIQDYSAAIQNMLLAITALGYASCWIEGQVTANAETQQQIANLLNLPSDYTVVGFLPVGVADTEIRRPAYKSFEERAWFNGFGR